MSLRTLSAMIALYAVMMFCIVKLTARSCTADDPKGPAIGSVIRIAGC